MTGSPVPASALTAGKRTFGASWSATSWASAPGRLELLGNHIDYNGGSVLAGAIDRTVQIAIGEEARGNRIEVALSFSDSEPFAISPESIGDWRSDRHQATPADYLTGVIAALKARSIPVRNGLQLAIAGDVPIGFGMSSSAALCVAAVLALAVDTLSDRDIVLIAQEAEHRSGSPVGAMDQSASVAGDIILFDGSNVTWEHLTPVLGDMIFAVAHSGVDHALSTSSYPVRVAESREALKLIQQHIDTQISSLAAIPDDRWEEIEAAGWLDPTLRNRVRHVVLEQRRVLQGVNVVSRRDWSSFGELMTASGQSSSGDYEISHPIVEELVATLHSLPGVLGARMMGGGEGGPALALLDGNAVKDVEAALHSRFYKRHPVSESGGAFQICRFGPGAMIS